MCVCVCVETYLFCLLTKRQRRVVETPRLPPSSPSSSSKCLPVLTLLFSTVNERIFLFVFMIGTLSFFPSLSLSHFFFLHGVLSLQCFISAFFDFRPTVCTCKSRIFVVFIAKDYRFYMIKTASNINGLCVLFLLR